jgi:hypothetical protein
VSRAALGQKVHAALVSQGRDAAQALALEAGQPDLFERVNAVASEDPAPSFLHSALCAMSLPIRRPADEHAPIIRQDGQYTLAITPRPVLLGNDAPQRLASLGVPYGTLPRLILIHIMSKAVRTKSRQVHLGDTFTAWMRHMGYKSISYGPRGSATLIRGQLDRLLACEWMIRWDNSRQDGAKEFGIKEIKLSSEYVGFDGRSGTFAREIRLTEGFFEHLCDHAVPLDENAIRQLRDSSTALDLYTWLAYRLPRLAKAKPATLNWQQLAVHFGNDGTHIRKFRQTVRDAWERQVSAVYPDARVDFDSTIIRLYPSPAPLNRTVVKGADLRLVSGTNPAPNLVDIQPEQDTLTDANGTGACFLSHLQGCLGAAEARAWLNGATMQDEDDGWTLHLTSAFKASWIRAQFGPALKQAASAAGLVTVPHVCGPSSPGKTR